MTVAYSSDVSNSGAFLKLLLRWRGSFLKLVWKDILTFSLLMIALNVIYAYVLPPGGQFVFEKIVLMCKTYTGTAPITFILGFYISILVNRWWEQFMLLPWPDPIAIMVSSYIEG